MALNYISTVESTKASQNFTSEVTSIQPVLADTDQDYGKFRA